jgi:hypothetical protein
MENLYNDLKARYGKAEIQLTDSNTIEIQFTNTPELVIIQKGIEPGRFVVSYPQERKHRKGYSMEHATSREILEEGLLWILKKVNQHGFVTK